MSSNLIKLTQESILSHTMIVSTSKLTITTNIGILTFSRKPPQDRIGKVD
jgi:hypothetical protein